MAEPWTLGEIAEMLDIPEHRIQYLFRSRKVPDVRRIGGRRVFTREDVQRVVAALGMPYPSVPPTEQTERPQIP